MKNILIILGLFCCTTIAVAQSDSVYLNNQDVERQRFLYYFYAGQVAFETKHYDQAMALFRFAESINPNDAAVHHSLGHMFVGLNNKQQAFEHYKKAYALDPVSYWESYANLLYNDKQYTETQHILEDVRKILPDNADVAEALTNVYMLQHKPKKALKLQNELVQKEGKNSYNTMMRYRILLLMNKPEKAIDVIRDYLKQNPDDYQMQTFLGDIYFSIGQDATALTIYQEEQKRHPDNPYVYLALAKLYEKNNQFEKAAYAWVGAIGCEELGIGEKIRLLRTNMGTIQMVPGLLEGTLQQLIVVNPLYEDYYFLLASIYTEQERYADAQDILHSLLALNPTHKEGWQLRLSILQADSTTSNEAFETMIGEAYALFPNEPQWCYYQASVYLMRENQDSAVAILQRGLLAEDSAERLPYKQAMRIHLGDLYSAREMLDSAYYYYEEVLQRDPKNIYTLNNYAYLLATHGGDLKKAERMSQITIEQEPNNAIYLDTYAWILHLQGVSSLAKFYIQKALDNIGNESGNEEIILHYNIINHLPKK